MVNYLLNSKLGIFMGGFRTIISANISVDVAQQLKGKTKGTRSRVVERALRAYLADKEAFNLEDVTTDKILLELQFRKELTDMQKELIRQMWKEVKE